MKTAFYFICKALFVLKIFQFLSLLFEYVYPKCHFVFLINRNMKLIIKFWFSFLYWSWDRKHQSKWFSDFRNNWTLKFRFEVCFSFFILIWKTKNQIYLEAVTLRNLNKSQVTLLKLIAASSKDFSINRQIFFFSRMCFLW